MNKIIKLTQSFHEKFTIPDNAQYLTDLNRFNIFIGANNSGKSRFLRMLFSEFNKIGLFDIKLEGRSKLEDHKIQVNNILQAPFTASQTYNLYLKNRETIDHIIRDPKLSDDSYFFNILKYAYKLANIEPNDFEYTRQSDISQLDGVINRYKKAGDQLKSLLSKIQLPANPINRMHIPILRGLRPLRGTEDLYFNREKKDHFNQSGIEKHIYTGSTIYDDVSKLKLGDDEDIRIISDFEYFLEKNIINEKINLIPRYKNDVLYIKIGDSDQYPIYKLGDGLQTLITILFPLHIRKDEQLAVFIEEPESHLHPAWQVLLLKCLKEFRNHQYFIATHSPIFMNDLESSIYIFTKKKQAIVINQSNLVTDKVEIIQQLGYKPSDIFQTNFILWVEGESDRIYLKYWIHKIAPKLVDGHHFSIMFYGGDNYRHFLQGEEEFSLSLIKSINQNFGIIFDSDRKKRTEHFNKEKKEIIDLFKQNNGYGWFTKKREIENYIPLDVFIKSVKTVHQKENLNIADGDFTDRGSIIDFDSGNSYKQKIRLPDNIFSTIQKNADGSTKGIDVKSLRKGIEIGLLA